MPFIGSAAELEKVAHFWGCSGQGCTPKALLSQAGGVAQRAPPAPISSQLLLVNLPVLPSAHTSPLLLLVLYETAPMTQPRTETWVQKPRWMHNAPTACMSRDPGCAASTKIWPKPRKTS